MRKPGWSLSSAGQSAVQAADTCAQLASYDLMHLTGGGIVGHPQGIAAGVASQGSLRIVKLLLDDVRQGPQALRSRFEEPRRAGADAVLAPRDAGTVPPLQPQPADATVLALSGSAAALSAAQIDEAVHSGYVEVALNTPRRLAEHGWQAPMDEACSRAADQIAVGRSVLLHAARGPQDPRVAAILQALEADGILGARAHHVGGRRPATGYWQHGTRQRGLVN